MPGVIGNYEGNPLYKTRPLKNVSLKVKSIGIFLRLLHYILAISNIPILIWLKIINDKAANKEEPTNNKDTPTDILAFLCLITCIGESLFVFLFDSYAECCTTQVVNCRLPKQNVGSWYVGLLIFGTLQVLGLLFSRAGILFKIVIIVFCVSTNLCAIGSLYYSKSFCQCKTCLGIKDVKLIYKGERYSISETNAVTSMNLQEWFEFTLAEGTRLAIQIRNGEIIHEFNDQRQNLSVQLHEGEYIIRDITYNVNPVVSSSIGQPARSTLRRTDKPEITSAEEEISIMNID